MKTIIWDWNGTLLDDVQVSFDCLNEMLEKYHLLYKLDLYMMKQVMLEMSERLAAGLPLLPVSVNFSAQDFDYRNIPEEIESLYHSTGADQLIPRSSIIVEITEQDMATATESFHEQLKALRGMGYRLWLDDFGLFFPECLQPLRCGSDQVRYGADPASR